MKNYWLEWVKDKGLEVGGKIVVTKNPRKIEKEGLEDNGGYVRWDETFQLMQGLLEYTKVRWKPKEGQQYYVPNVISKNFYTSYTYYESEFHDEIINRNIALRKPEEAIEVTKKMLEVVGVDHE